MARRLSAAVVAGALVVPGVLMAAQPASADGEMRVDLTVGLSDHINLAGAGLVPAVLLSTPALDTTTLDLDSVRLGSPGSDGAAPARAQDGTVMATVRDVNGDDRDDLVLHF